MSSNANTKPVEGAAAATEQDFGEPRKMNETFETEVDDSDCSDNDDEEEELPVEDAALDVLDQLVELFVEKNGREPNQEEVMQWIDVFKSLQIEDGSPVAIGPTNTDSATANE